MASKYVTLEGLKIHYQIHGQGPTRLLLIHGAAGSCNDFQLQLKSREFGLDSQQFTVVAYDMPGYGQSQLPGELSNDPTLEYFELCARMGAQLMRELKFKTYSVGGWSDGARVACLLAIRCQSRVNALILWGFVPSMDKQSCYALARTRDTGTWDPSALQFYSSVYGEEGFSDLWHKYVDFIISTLELTERFDLSDQLHNIKCPTLILHGTSDPIVSFSDHVKPLEMKIYDSDIIRFKGAAHNIHQADPERFNQVLSRFVINVVS